MKKILLLLAILMASSASAESGRLPVEIYKKAPMLRSD